MFYFFLLDYPLSLPPLSFETQLCRLLNRTTQDTNRGYDRFKIEHLNDSVRIRTDAWRLKINGPSREVLDIICNSCLFCVV